MTVLRESPWYLELSQEAEARGEARGRIEGELAVILRLLNRRVGTISPDVMAQIQRLPLESLETLSDALLDFTSVQDLQNWLDNCL